ncbi:hypothetical protein TRFO_13201 [Tritrichomonas foetus]|uniref:Uncharacterized protein n=1 Tax=Tritrichomonas foetus TaxID=1144522 RepID=A0A1J4L311_9EUKA|nr:hypothetical protein TRFO_13201 [Tritrichomonas foetus]|eukprot:OHT16364.1 hypothetical protein TRFO_13201 [Tritrichomonas foetus]
MSIASFLKGKTDPLLKVPVTLSQYIKITKTSQPLGVYPLIISPSDDGITLAFQMPGANPVVSTQLNSKFNYTVQEKNSWSIVLNNKTWIVEFKDEKDMAKALCVVGLVLGFKDENAVMKYDLPGHEKTGKEINLGDRVQISYYVFTFSEFPYIDKIFVTKTDAKTNMSSAANAKGFVQGMVGMTRNESRVIFVPAALSASDKKNQCNPIDNVMFYVTLKHAKYSSEGGAESETTETEQESETSHQNEETVKETSRRRSSAAGGSSVVIPPPSTTIPPPAEKAEERAPPQKDDEPEEKPANDIMSRIKKIGGMAMGMPMGMPISYERKRQQQRAEEEARRQQEEQQNAKDDSEEETEEETEEPVHQTTSTSAAHTERRISNVKPTTNSTETPKYHSPPQRAQFTEGTVAAGAPRTSLSTSSAFAAAQSVAAQNAAALASSASSSSKKGLFDTPRGEDSKDLLQRLENLEKTIDRKLSLICGDNAELVDPDSIIRGISSLAVQLKMKTSECETIKKQLAQAKAKQSGAAASERQLEAARKELNDEKKLKVQLEQRVRISDSKVKELEKQAVETAESAKKNGSTYVKGMMSKVFDDMNNSFSEEGIYNGGDISNLLYDLLRKHAFETMNDISSNGLF